MDMSNELKTAIETEVQTRVEKALTQRIFDILDDSNCHRLSSVELAKLILDAKYLDRIDEIRALERPSGGYIRSHPDGITIGDVPIASYHVQDCGERQFNVPKEVMRD